MTAETNERRSDWKIDLLKRLHDPVQLRIAVIAGVLALGYAAVYRPLTDRIAAAGATLERQQRLLRVAESLEHLKKQYHRFADRLPQQADTKEWAQYVLDGTRQFPLKVINLDCRDPRKMGPYPVIVLQIEMEGPFLELDKFLKWLEANRRLMRIDDLTFSPSRGRNANQNLVMRLTVLGLSG